MLTVIDKYKFLGCLNCIDDVYNYFYNRLNKYCKRIEIFFSKSSYLNNVYKFEIICYSNKNKIYKTSKVISVMELNLSKYNNVIIMFDEIANDLINSMH